MATVLRPDQKITLDPALTRTLIIDTARITRADDPSADPAGTPQVPTAPNGQPYDHSFIASTERVATDGGIIRTSAWNLAKMRRRWISNHDIYGSAINHIVLGKIVHAEIQTGLPAARVGPSGRALVEYVKYASTPFAQEVKTLFDEGALDEVSVRWDPRTEMVRMPYEEEILANGNDLQWVAEYVEQLELSAVIIAADAGATKRSGSVMVPSVNPRVMEAFERIRSHGASKALPKLESFFRRVELTRNLVMAVDAVIEDRSADAENASERSGAPMSAADIVSAQLAGMIPGVAADAGGATGDLDRALNEGEADNASETAQPVDTSIPAGTPDATMAGAEDDTACTGCEAPGKRKSMYHVCRGCYGDMQSAKQAAADAAEGRSLRIRFDSIGGADAAGNPTPDASTTENDDALEEGMVRRCSRCQRAKRMEAMKAICSRCWGGMPRMDGAAGDSMRADETPLDAASQGDVPNTAQDDDETNADDVSDQANAPVPAEPNDPLADPDGDDDVNNKEGALPDINLVTDVRELDPSSPPEGVLHLGPGGVVKIGNLTIQHSASTPAAPADETRGRRSMDVGATQDVLMQIAATMDALDAVLSAIGPVREQLDGNFAELNNLMTASISAPDSVKAAVNGAVGISEAQEVQGGQQEPPANVQQATGGNNETENPEAGDTTAAPSDVTDTTEADEPDANATPDENAQAEANQQAQADGEAAPADAASKDTSDADAEDATDGGADETEEDAPFTPTNKTKSKAKKAGAKAKAAQAAGAPRTAASTDDAPVRDMADETDDGLDEAGDEEVSDDTTGRSLVLDFTSITGVPGAAATPEPKRSAFDRLVDRLMGREEPKDALAISASIFTKDK